MSDDLVTKLRNLGPDDSGFREIGVAAATALTEARAEIETKAQAIADLARQIYEMQSELSTLRARVREVVGGVLAHSCVADAGPDCKDEDDEAAERAARKLVEDLK